MPETLDRITLDSSDTPKYTSKPHIAAYQFASSWVTKGETVFDLACGTGYGVERADAGKFIGVDCSGEAVHHARTHFGDSRRIFLAMCGIQPQSASAS